MERRAEWPTAGHGTRPTRHPTPGAMAKSNRYRARGTSLDLGGWKMSSYLLNKNDSLRETLGGLNQTQPMWV